MKLFFVRHGETEWNRLHKVQGQTDIPLNDTGRLLARKTAEGLKDTPIDMAVTSPLIRARQTAEIILAGRNVPVYVDDRIREISFGVCEGMSVKQEMLTEKEREFNKIFDDPANYEAPEGAETIPDFMGRVGDFLQSIYKDGRLKDKSILISTHGAALRAMLNCIERKTDIAGFWEGGVPKNCSVTEVQVKDGIPKIIKQGIIYD